MPTFDFRCQQCKHTFEASIAFGSKRFPACPSCGKKKVEKLLTKPLGISFKGSGFYATDSVQKDESGKNSGPKPDTSAPSGNS